MGQPQQPSLVVSGTRPHQPAGRSRQAHMFQESHLKKDESQTLKPPGTRLKLLCQNRAGSDVGPESCRAREHARRRPWPEPRLLALIVGCSHFLGTVPVKPTAILQRGSFLGNSPFPSCIFLELCFKHRCREDELFNCYIHTSEV